MKRFFLTYEEKQIVYATIRMDSKAGNNGRSDFLKKGKAAIQKAREEIDLGDMTPEIREIIIGKIQQSIADAQPWELMGETYCSRGTFYQYRKQFSYMVADNMGIIDQKRRARSPAAAGSSGRRAT